MPPRRPFPPRVRAPTPRALRLARSPSCGGVPSPVRAGGGLRFRFDGAAARLRRRCAGTFDLMYIIEGARSKGHSGGFRGASSSAVAAGEPRGAWRARGGSGAAGARAALPAPGQGGGRHRSCHWRHCRRARDEVRGARGAPRTGGSLRARGHAMRAPRARATRRTRPARGPYSAHLV